MTISRVTRVSNPRKRRTSSKRRSNPKRLSLKQKLHFGSARQRAAAKAALSRKRNPKKRRTAAVKHRKRNTAPRASNPVRRRKRRASNPAHMITLGLVNPSPRRAKTTRRKKANMATKTKRRTRRAASNPRRRRRNSVRVIVRRSRRRAVAANPRRRRRSSYRANPRRRHHHRARRSSRNPVIFGRSVGIVEAAKVIAAGLGGVYLTSIGVGMLPANLLPSTPVTGALVSAGVAIGLGMVAGMIFKSDPMIGYAIGFGGLMQAGGVLAKQFGYNQFGLRGLGDLVPGRFPVPQNPIMAGQQVMLPPPAMPSPGAATGVGAIFNPYGRAM
jgi:hypothetical protein